jgi:hypothetical protein
MFLLKTYNTELSVFIMTTKIKTSSRDSSRETPHYDILHNECLVYIYASIDRKDKLNHKKERHIQEYKCTVVDPLTHP